MTIFYTHFAGQHNISQGMAGHFPSSSPHENHWDEYEDANKIEHKTSHLMWK
jgi:hypothetical protein